MAVELRLRGAYNLTAVGKQLQEAGDKELRKELLRGIRTATAPAKSAVKASAMAKLPKKGGLNKVVADAKIATRTRTSGRQAGVRIAATTAELKSIARIDSGKVRHPVHPKGTDRKKWTWVEQDVEPGFFTEPMKALAPSMRKELVLAIARVAAKLKP